MANFDINVEIQKELNSLEPEEKDINKITKATHRSLLMMSVKDAVMEIRKEEEEEKEKGKKRRRSRRKKRWK